MRDRRARQAACRWMRSRRCRNALRGTGLVSVAVAGLLATGATAARANDPLIVVNARHPLLFAAAPLRDKELARMRGGLTLPNGLNIVIGIDIQTRVDDLLVLHSIYTTDGPEAGVRVFTDGADSVKTAPGTITVETGAEDATPMVTVSRSPTGTTVAIAGPSMPATVNVLSGPPSTWILAAGETPVPVTDNGPAVATPRGEIRLVSDDRGATVTLAAPDLEIRHLIGQTTGVVVANAANDRAIDTISALNLDLRGLPSSLAAGLALSDALALDIATAR